MPALEAISKLVDLLGELCPDVDEIRRRTASVVPSQDIHWGRSATAVWLDLVLILRDSPEKLLALVEQLATEYPDSVLLAPIRLQVNECCTSFDDSQQGMRLDRETSFIPVDVFDHARKAAIIIGHHQRALTLDRDLTQLTLELAPAMAAHEGDALLARDIGELGRVVLKQQFIALRDKPNAGLELLTTVANDVKLLVLHIKQTAADSIEIQEISQRPAAAEYELLFILLQCKLRNHRPIKKFVPAFVEAMGKFERCLEQFELSTSDPKALFVSIINLCRFAQEIHVVIQMSVEFRFTQSRKAFLNFLMKEGSTITSLLEDLRPHQGDNISAPPIWMTVHNPL